MERPSQRLLVLASSLAAACTWPGSQDGRSRLGAGASEAGVPTPATGPIAAGPGRSGSAARGAVIFETPRGTWVVDAELARSPAERERGLMFRRDLPADQGMLFLFEEARVQRFWMHDTYVALDMIFLDDDRAVVGVVANAAPLTDTPRGVDRPSRYVLEVVAGAAAAHAIGPGVRARFANVPDVLPAR
jgi:uncharacterized membrane protein (UPF0127 family)